MTPAWMDVDDHNGWRFQGFFRLEKLNGIRPELPYCSVTASPHGTPRLIRSSRYIQLISAGLRGSMDAIRTMNLNGEIGIYPCGVKKAWVWRSVAVLT